LSVCSNSGGASTGPTHLLPSSNRSFFMYTFRMSMPANNLSERWASLIYSFAYGVYWAWGGFAMGLPLLSDSPNFGIGQFGAPSFWLLAFSSLLRLGLACVFTGKRTARFFNTGKCVTLACALLMGGSLC